MGSYGAQQSDKVRLGLDIQPIVVAIDTAIPCGLVLNELISNTLKHAFPQGRNGNLTIDLRCQNDEITLIVRDDGIGTDPDEDLLEKGKLGLEAAFALTDQLGGTPAFITGRSGLTACLAFPNRAVSTRLYSNTGVP